MTGAAVTTGGTAPMTTLGFADEIEASFQQGVAYLNDHLWEGEHFTLELTAEQSQFTRLNHAKVRQTGIVADGNLDLTLMANERRSFRTFPLTGDRALDTSHITEALQSLRNELPQLPPDPYLVLPRGSNTSRDAYAGTLLPSDQIAMELLTPVADLDFTGIYAGGTIIRGYADSAGQLHWFATASFTLDYSIFTADGQAVKGTVAGRNWNPDDYQAKLTDSRKQLERMAVEPKAIAPGSYRTYLAPAAVAELISMLSWGGVSEASLQKGDSALNRLRRGEATLSPQFVLKENFSQGLVPRFNDIGEVAPLSLTVIEQGQLCNSLISARTAKEYGLASNGAAGWEGLRSPDVSPGTLATPDILKALDTGLYLSNLHYLNWSDRPTGRITGMTRYACFWVENGNIVAPIENLRFDDSLYQFFGEQLVALTDQAEFIPEVGSYERREIGGTWTPGILVDQFAYTL
ncbi:MAG: TldD/PmbA family protein [Leptolyngbyaceae bacterium]|nr:TldD/PmbA family protein [Leptolyngbyaceae bacterium]